MADKYFWRQSFILFAGLLYSVCVGFTLGYPAVLNNAITSPNCTDLKTTGEHASWIAAMSGIGGLAGSFIIAPIMHNLGRKASQFSMNGFILIGWIIIPFATNIAGLYAARFIQGISVGNVYLNSIVISEYVHPSHRGFFITLKKVSIAFGTLCCHAMSAFWTWRQIAIAAAIPPFLAIILVFFWPESPSHLALKGRYLDCETSFKWLYGTSEENEKHLKSLIEAQKKKIARMRKRNSVLVLKKQFLTKNFQKALWISSILTLALDVCGRYYFVAYAIQIMMELLNDQDSALYFTLGADVFILIALLLSAPAIRYVKRRTILLSSGVISVFLMLLISVITYLKTVYSFSKYLLWFTALIIILQCFIVNIGLIPIAFTLTGEIFHLEHKGLGTCVSGVVFTVLYAVMIKITPFLMERTSLYGTYAIYGVILALCMVFLYKTVPETKDKTLQEIEDADCAQNFEIIRKERKTLIHCKETEK